MTFAGRRDAFALSGVAGGFIAANPWLATQADLLPLAMGSAAVGGGYLASKFFRRHLDTVDMDSRKGFVMPSDNLYPPTMGLEGLRLGYTKDRHLPLDAENDLACRHGAVIGATGVGKTVLGEYLMWQQICRGGGLLFIDAKLDKDTRDKLAWMAAVNGRSDDFYVINTSDPKNSNTYNPLNNGDGAEIAARLLSLVPITEGNPGADHFKQQANTAVMSLVNKLKSAGYRFHFGDLALLLQSPKAMDAVAGLGGRGSAEERALQIWMDQFRTFGKGGSVSLDMKKVKENFGGISGRVAQFAQGGFGEVFNTYTPDVDFLDVMKTGKIVYVMLPTMAKDVMATNLGKLVISDLRNAIAYMQNMPKDQRPNPPFLCFLDEFGSYSTASAATIVEQGRSASVSVWLAFQSLGNLDSVSEDFKAKILQNTWLKCIFRMSNTEDAEAATEMIGQRVKFSQTLSSGHGSGESSPLTQVSPEISESDQDSASEGWREAEAARVSIDQLTALEKGEMIVSTQGSMFHVRVPMVLAPQGIPEFRAQRRNIPMPHGIKPLNFEVNYQNYISTREDAKAAAAEEKKA